MKKITQNFYQAKTKNTGKVLFGLFALTLMSTQVSLAQQATGEFPVMEGSFETTALPVTLGTSSSNLNVLSGVELATWTFGTTANNTLAFNSSVVRSGGKSLDWSNSSTSAVLNTPTASSGAIAASTSYVVQFYYWKNSAGTTARNPTVQITADGSGNFGTAVNTGVLGAADKSASTAWTKVSVVVSTNTAPSAGKFGFVRFKSGGTVPNILLDDFVVYAGSAEDVTAPDAVASANAAVSGGGVDVSWTASGTGVDGGGYLVVRYDVAPNADNDPNVNGIYSVGNTITNGTAALVGTVVYTGVGTSFTDAAGVAGSHYKVYAVDKAFNYSDEVQPTLGVNDVSFSENTVSVYKNNGVLNVNAGNVVIANIKVYDLQGKLVAEQKNVDATATTVKDLKAANQVLVVKVTSQDGSVVTKKVVN